MMRQITVMKFRDDVTTEMVDEVGRGFAAIANIVPGIRRFEFGPDMRLMEGAWDYALVIDFEDEDAWSTYRQHPDHLKFAEQFAPYADAAVRVQYQVD